MHSEHWVPQLEEQKHDMYASSRSTPASNKRKSHARDESGARKRARPDNPQNTKENTVPRTKSDSALQYDTLSEAEDQFRLLKILPRCKSDRRIRCDLRTFERRTAPYYQAVSYEWGSTNRYSTIEVNGQSLSVSENLWFLLDSISRRTISHLSEFSDRHEQVTRVFAPRYLWIDQISINQASDVEKARQVQMMAQTFAQASRVICWLGSEPFTGPLASHCDACAGKDVKYIPKQSSHCCNVLDYLQKKKTLDERYKQARDRRQAKDESLSDPLSPDEDAYDSDEGEEEKLDAEKRLLCSQTFEALFAGSYWTRLWIAQEFVLARAILLVNGREAVPWVVAKKVFDELLTVLGLDLKRGAYTCFKHIDHQHMKMPMERVLHVFGELECSNPRDKLYGLLGMCSDSAGFDVDYTRPASDVFWQAVAFWKWQETEDRYEEDGFEYCSVYEVGAGWLWRLGQLMGVDESLLEANGIEPHVRCRRVVSAAC